MLTNSRLAVLRTALRPALLALLLASLLPAFVPFARAYAQSGTCKSSTNGSYTVALCITQPAAGTALTGVIPVTATATITGSSSGIGKLVFTLDGTYVLTDYQAPYTFQLSTANYANGTHTLAVSATMRDGFVTAAPAVTVTFNNAGAPPPGPNFVPVAPAPRPAGQSLIMAAVGDGAGGETNAGLVTQMIDGWNPDLVLYLGDVYEKGSFAEFYNWYGQANSFYGLFRDVTNPTIGNHEYENGAAPGYFSYWYNIPNYYSYNAGGWHFIALNSTSQFKQTATTSPQYQWLVADLNANTAPCTVAYFHHPVLSVGPQGDTPSLNAIWSQLVQSGVDLVLTGHDHGYQRWMPLDANLNPVAAGTQTGATEFVSGAGGHAVQNFVRTDPRFVVGYGDPVNAYGSLYFKLNPKGAEYRYINTGGQVLDQGVVACSGAAPDTAPPFAPANLAAATSPSGHVLLTWSPAWDETGVTAYGIYRDGTLVATVGGAASSYVDTNVGLNVTYSYQVDAVDLGGRRSPQSNTAAITRGGQATLVFTPSADTYVQGDLPTTNYGTALVLKADASPDTQSFLRFNLQGLAGTVNSATLRLYASNGSSIGYGAYALGGGTWTETATTYSNKPAVGSLAGSSGSYTAGSWAPANVLPLVTANGDLDVAVKTTSNTSLSYNSREGANPPQLVVNISSSQGAPTATPTLPPTATPTATGTPLPTATATATPLPTATPAGLPPTATPAATNTPLPTATATVPATVPATTLIFTPVADAYVSSSAPTTNYGTALTLRVDSSAPVQRSYLRFDLQGVTAPVTRATLRVYASSASSAGYTGGSLAGTWAETTVTYNTPLTVGTSVAGSGSFTANSWTGIDVTTLVAGSGTLDLAVLPLSATGIAFSSRQGANPPQLVVEFGGTANGAANGAAAPAVANLVPPDLPAATATGTDTDTDTDTDGDGAPDAVELLAGSSLTSVDTDGDGLLDLWEIEWGLSPADATGANGAAGDPDADGSANLAEQWYGTDPLDGPAGQTTDQTGGQPAQPPARGSSPLFLPLVSHD